MKNMKIAGLVLVLGGFSTPAIASCPSNNLEGEYWNSSRDLFRIVQTDCDHISLEDVHARWVYNFDFKNPNNVMYTPPGTLIGQMNRALPITASLKPGLYEEGLMVWDKGVTITFKTKLPIRQSETTQGLNSPDVILTFYITPSNQGNGSTGLSMGLVQFKATEDPNSNLIQKAFVRGINLAIAILDRFLSTKKLGETLYRMD